MTTVDVTLFCGRIPTHTPRHTHRRDRIKLRASGLAEPCSHSRNLPAMLTSVSMPLKLNSLKKPPPYVWTNSFTLTELESDSEPQ